MYSAKTKERFKIGSEYRSPNIEIVEITCRDIIVTSGKDNNQGEWDPQDLDGNM